MNSDALNWGFNFVCENMEKVDKLRRWHRQIRYNSPNSVIYWELKLICRSGRRECNWNFPHVIKLKMKMTFLALIVQCCINITFGQAFDITRASHGRDGFNMPASICKRDDPASGSGCGSFYAVDGVRDCTCLCPAKNATFTFHNKRWSCVENRKLRRHLSRGKRILFNSNYVAFNRESWNKLVWAKKNPYSFEIYFRF